MDSLSRQHSAASVSSVLGLQKYLNTEFVVVRVQALDLVPYLSYSEKLININRSDK